MIKKLVNLTILLIVLFSMNRVAIAASHVMFNISQEVLVFTDMHGHWAQETVNWAVQKGVVTGYTDGTFKPSNEVTEAEFLAMLVRVYKPEIKTATGGHWADNYYSIAKENNYPVGKDSRNTIISRGYVAELVAATQGVNYVGDNAIQFLLGNGLARGNDANKITIPSYNAKGKLSRAEAVQFIKNLIEKGNQELGARPTTPSDISQLPSLPGSVVPPPVTNPGAVMIGDVEYVGVPNEGQQQIPMDSIARPIMKEIVESITVKDGVLTIKIPKLPTGYEVFLKYSDFSGPNGAFVEGKSFSVNPAKEDNVYRIPYDGTNGRIVTSVGRFDNKLFHNVDGVIIQMPSLQMTSEFGGW